MRSVSSTSTDLKLVNDTAGHAAGDALLQQVAHAIRRACRSQDFTARIGGDEFALLLADCSITGARKAAQQVIDSIAGGPLHLAGQDLRRRRERRHNRRERGGRRT